MKEEGKLHLELTLQSEMEQIEVISDGKVIETFDTFSDRFAADITVPHGRYYRVRGWGKMQKRKYEDGEFEPVFLLNPIYC